MAGQSATPAPAAQVSGQRCRIVEPREARFSTPPAMPAGRPRGPRLEAVQEMSHRNRHFAPVFALALLAQGCGDEGASAPGGLRDAGADGAAVGTGGTDGAGGESGAAGGAAGTPGSGGTPSTGACTSDDECSGATSHCDTANGTCTGCASDADCLGSLHCDAPSGECRDCVTDDHCGGPVPVCDPVSRQCSKACTSDADCATTGGPMKCDTQRGRCVDCTGNGQPCPFCELDTYSCVGCLVDTDCPAARPFCGPSYECTGECNADSDCTGGLFCHIGLHRCVECATNAHCGGETCQVDFTCG